jgi:hypothetical protein
MKAKSKLFPFLIAFLLCGVTTNAPAKESEWVRIPSHWLLSRFVRASTAPEHSFKIALTLPPGTKEPKVVQSCGFADVDTLAADFAMESVRGNKALKDLAKTKQLDFRFVVTPPMLDIKLRSEEGKKPMPAGKEAYFPETPGIIWGQGGQSGPTSRRGKLTVVFPPEGGHAVCALVVSSTGSPMFDRYFLHNSALNWQVATKSSENQILRRDFGERHLNRWESILDP